MPASAAQSTCKTTSTIFG